MDPQTQIPPEPMPARRRPSAPSAPARRKKRRLGPLGILLMLGCLGVFGGMALVFVFMLMVFLDSGKVNTGNHAVLRLTIEGTLEAYEPPNAFDFLLGPPAPYMYQYLDMLEDAAGHQGIHGILLEIGPNTLSWAQSEELRDALSQFAQSGKWIVAYGESFNEQDYFLASVADEVFMTPEGLMEVDGFMASTAYYADLLERYGVNVHVEAIGEFKSMADGYRYNEGTEPVRTATLALLESCERSFVQTVSQARDLAADTIPTLMERTVNTALEAKDAGLIDDLLYRNEMEQKLKERVGGGFQLINHDAWRYGVESFERHSVAVIYATGTIQSGHSGQGLFGDKVLGSSDFVSLVRQAATDRRIKAVVIRIDSPGGSMLASDVMWQEIKLLAEKKPVIASMGSIAASGGYYMAMGCDAIIAQPNTITGSIGVVTMRMDFSRFYDQLAINMDVVKTSGSADFWDASRQLTEVEKADLAVRTQDAYHAFITKAATSRNLGYEEMDRVARGRPWSGADALELGLVDELGGLEDAIALAAKKADLRRYSVVRYPTEDQWELINQNLIATDEARMLSSFGQLLPAELRMLANVVDRRRKVHVLAISPYSININ